MKKLLRYLIGGRAKAAPPLQTRIEPAHELAMKAVVRRRSESAKIEARGDASGGGRSPVVSRQVAPIGEGVIRRSGGEAAVSPPREERRATTATLPSRVSPVVVSGKARHQLADLAMYSRLPAKPAPAPQPKAKPRITHRLADIGGASGYRANDGAGHAGLTNIDKGL